jgi:hypothetical protein
MKIKQIAVFLENKAGRLGDIAATLGEINVNIRAMSLADTVNFGIVRLIVDDTERAQQVLKDRGFTVRITEVIAAKIVDRPGELGQLLKLIEQAALNVAYIYGVTDSTKDSAVLIIRLDDLDRAIRILSENHYELLNSDQIAAA